MYYWWFLLLHENTANICTNDCLNNSKSTIKTLHNLVYGNVFYHYSVKNLKVTQQKKQNAAKTTPWWYKTKIQWILIFMGEILTACLRNAAAKLPWNPQDDIKPFSKNRLLLIRNANKAFEWCLIQENSCVNLIPFLKGM